jgi:hypothetical protein
MICLKGDTAIDAVMFQAGIAVHRMLWYRTACAEVAHLWRSDGDRANSWRLLRLFTVKIFKLTMICAPDCMHITTDGEIF